MSKSSCELVRPDNMRSDVHPLAMLETEQPIMECVACGLPVPEEACGDIYCNKDCQDAHMDEALFNDAIKEASLETFFAGMVIELPSENVCSCHLAR